MNWLLKTYLQINFASLGWLCFLEFSFGSVMLSWGCVDMICVAVIENYIVVP